LADEVISPISDCELFAIGIRVAGFVHQFSITSASESTLPCQLGVPATQILSPGGSITVGVLSPSMITVTLPYRD
jgi:hypothetical protein